MKQTKHYRHLMTETSGSAGVNNQGIAEYA